MKLKNKKTGEIIEFDAILPVKDVAGDSVAHLEYDSLAELNEEWCDYEEPEEFYIVEQRGTVGSRFRTGAEYEEKFKEIGNHFETREEAEKVVEKLKAWKRLKDKGFKFSGWEIDQKKHLGVITIKTEPYYSFEFEDLDLLFGGEE